MKVYCSIRYPVPGVSIQLTSFPLYRVYERRFVSDEGIIRRRNISVKRYKRHEGIIIIKERLWHNILQSQNYNIKRYLYSTLHICECV